MPSLASVTELKHRTSVCLNCSVQGQFLTDMTVTSHERHAVSNHRQFHYQHIIQTNNNKIWKCIVTSHRWISSQKNASNGESAAMSWLEHESPGEVWYIILPISAGIALGWLHSVHHTNFTRLLGFVTTQICQYSSGGQSYSCIMLVKQFWHLNWRTGLPAL